ncbi:MAG: spore coat protein CotJB [Oscillospiraceae bacterium]|nr:spore coat protein CotJB [Oscillospiraceae bacterium]
MPTKETLAMVSLPMQEYRNLYCPMDGLARGTLFQELEKPLEVETPATHKLKGKRLPLEFSAVNFALDDLRLFLDTHPEDTAALAQYQELLTERAKLADQLCAQTGMVTWHCPAEDWNWVKTHFPWM